MRTIIKQKSGKVYELKPGEKLSDFIKCPYCGEIVRMNGRHIDRCSNRFFKQLYRKITDEGSEAGKNE